MAGYRLGAHAPVVHGDAYVSEHAIIIGDVEICEGASIWPGAILRGDSDKIVIGRNSNVQDGAVIHADPGFPVRLGDAVSIGHLAMIHGCTIGSNCIIGIHAILLNGSHIGENCLVGAGSVIPENRHYDAGSLIVGTPGRVIRALSVEAIDAIANNAVHYRTRGARYSTTLERVF